LKIAPEDALVLVAPLMSLMLLAAAGDQAAPSSPPPEAAPDAAALPRVLSPYRFRAFGPAPRATEFAGAFACAGGKCGTRAPVSNARTADRR
jgi:hypothetical protein